MVLITSRAQGVQGGPLSWMNPPGSAELAHSAAVTPMAWPGWPLQPVALTGSGWTPSELL